MIGSQDRQDQDKLQALVSSNSDKRVKSYGYLKNQDKAVLRKKSAMSKRILVLMWKYED